MSARLKSVGLLASIGIVYVTWKIYSSGFEYKFLSAFIGGVIVGTLVFGDYD